MTRIAPATCQAPYPSEVYHRDNGNGHGSLNILGEVVTDAPMTRDGQPRNRLKIADVWLLREGKMPPINGKGVTMLGGTENRVDYL